MLNCLSLNVLFLVEGPCSFFLKTLPSKWFSFLSFVSRITIILLSGCFFYVLSSISHLSVHPVLLTYRFFLFHYHWPWLKFFVGKRTCFPVEVSAGWLERQCWVCWWTRVYILVIGLSVRFAGQMRWSVWCPHQSPTTPFVCECMIEWSMVMYECTTSSIFVIFFLSIFSSLSTL